MSFMDEINKIPPVTRFLCGATLGVTIPVMLEFVSIYKVLFVPKLVYPGLELWRIPASFFYAGKGIPFIFDMVMLYRNSDSLESIRYSRRSFDYAWQLLLCSGVLLILNIPINSYVHFRALLVSLVYVSCMLEPDATVSIFGLVSIPAKYFPYAMMAMDVLSAPQGGIRAAAGTLTGIIAGHAWYLLMHRDPARAPKFGYAPAWFRQLIGTGETPQQRDAGVDRRVFGAAAAPRGRTLNDGGARPAANDAGSGHDWGTGHRLGTE